MDCRGALTDGWQCRFGPVDFFFGGAAGNNSGTVSIYDALTGARVASLSSDKVKSPVWSCAMSEAGDHVIAATGAGLILRYEYVRNDGECDGMSEKRRDGSAERRDAMEVDEAGT